MGIPVTSRQGDSCLAEVVGGPGGPGYDTEVCGVSRDQGAPPNRVWMTHGGTVTPEAGRMAVFKSGTSTGFRGLIPTGGYCPPSSGVGGTPGRLVGF